MGTDLKLQIRRELNMIPEIVSFEDLQVSLMNKLEHHRPEPILHPHLEVILSSQNNPQNASSPHSLPWLHPNAVTKVHKEMSKYKVWLKGGRYFRCL